MTEPTFAELAERYRTPPLNPAAAGVRTVRGAATEDDPIIKGAILRDTAPATDKPIEERAMPRGVYNRKKKTADAAPPEAKKQRRKRRAAPEADLGALALEALLESAAHLAATVREAVDMDDAPELARALRSYEVACKIRAAAA